ncbi:amino acid transporter, putative [Perkinsus marinus ATCC 50983]|uniref:Amino acid transporter, putative n=1 Tax=Perkinsus marinus (strain ATCC 50983 / TXsc) TaxID=423536 RepID=C5L9P0_PERM5|nr:amino acid transporter, putative [Perkinsus marinus ATCC 50983]EER06554.1 amino acid transporter, putative [Perkinsus marinus ATCC 50983]|eukprot:XP_002774738.1 amino acid transporter, putative [Perkinsus marinus ATCC 50983]
MLPENCTVNEEPAAQAITPPESNIKKPQTPVKTRRIGLISVIAIAYFNVSGGPFGSEDIFSTGGPLLGIIGIFAALILWSLPMSFMTAELSSTFPSNGGYSLWVKVALGNFWAFQQMYWSWIAAAVDASVYPVLIYDTIAHLTPTTLGALPWFTAWPIKVAISAVLTVPMLFPVETTGFGMLAMTIFILFPFVIVVIWGLFKADLSVLGQTRPLREIDWINWAVVCFWRMTGMNAVSTVAGEVKQPGRTVIRACLWCMVIVTIQHIAVLGVSAGLGDVNWKDWSDGFLAVIIKDAFGPVMGWWIVIVAIVASAGQYMADILEASYLLFGMSRYGLSPAWLGKVHSRFETPWNGIFFQLFIVSCLVAADFSAILAINSFVAVLAALLQFVSFLVLRRSRPELNRPFKVPVASFWLICVLTLPTLAYGCLVVVVTLMNGWLPLTLNSTIFTIGLVFGYVSLWHANKRGRLQDWEEEADYGDDEVQTRSS